MSEQLLIRCLLLLVGAALVLGRTAQADELAPFRAPNLNPPSAIIALPLWMEVPERTNVGFTTEIANHYRLKRREGDQVILDGETLRLRGYVEQPFGDNWSFGVDVPYFYQSGGVLDNTIDAWHSALGLPDGGRNQRPEDVLEFELSDPAGIFFALDDPGGGLGDVQLSLARRIGAGRGWHLRGTLKLPTGRESVLAGSGSTDMMFSALRVVRGDLKGRSASYFFGGAVIDIEQPSVVRFPTEDHAYAAVIGGALKLGRRLGIKGQIDADSALYNSRLAELGKTAVQGTLGGWLNVGDTGVFEFAICEDLHVTTTPDVVVYFNLRWRLP